MFQIFVTISQFSMTRARTTGGGCLLVLTALPLSHLSLRTTHSNLASELLHVSTNRKDRITRT